MDFKIYTKEELDELSNLEDSKIEERRFSSYESREISDDYDTEMYAGGATLNIRMIINYMSMDLKDQFRYLTIAVKRYVPILSRSKDKKQIDTCISYVTSELARMIIQAKNKIVSGEATNINQVLGLNRLGGGEVTKAGIKLTRFLVRADLTTKKTGVIPKNISKEINLLYSQLTSAVLDKLGLTKLTSTASSVPMDNTEVTVRSVRMNSYVDTELYADIVHEDTTNEYVIDNLDISKIDEVEEFLHRLDVGPYNLEYDSGLLKITIFNKLDNNKQELFKYFIDNE